ncbi:uncharacterized protein LOC126818058, partial [Patella vulgata]|uniref:uncharacterized protein LOC126818058 n=1 Tax=Patella vulgata TaxID=6465 RepID=UPI0024A906F4
VAMTLERYIVVKYPLKAAGWVTKTRTKRIIFAVGVFSSLINIPQGTLKTTFHLIHAVIDNMMYINHALNFILYVVSGKKFRKELKTIFLNKILSVVDNALA